MIVREQGPLTILKLKYVLVFHVLSFFAPPCTSVLVFHVIDEKSMPPHTFAKQIQYRVITNSAFKAVLIAASLEPKYLRSCFSIGSYFTLCSFSIQCIRYLTSRDCVLESLFVFDYIFFLGCQADAGSSIMGKGPLKNVP